MKQNFAILSFAVALVFILVQLVNTQAVCDPICANAGVCVAPQTCQCREGFTGPSCLNKTCGQGTLNPDNNFCQCNPGWIGQDCLTCQTDDACKAIGKGKCSTSVVIDSGSTEKFFSCKVLGPLSVYLGDNVTWDCNTVTKDCSFETWLNYEGKQQELFWCKFDNCTMNVDSSNAVYACTKSVCACTNQMPCNDILKKILLTVTGSGSLTCSLDKQSCTFKHVNFPFGTVPLQCSGGVCQ